MTRTSFSKIKLIFFHWLFMTMLACTRESATPTPSLSDYQKNTDLMIKVASKFIDDHDAQKVHDAAVAIQLTRAISCTDYNEECTLYANLITAIIDATDDGRITIEERTGLLYRLTQLKAVVQDGIDKIQKAKR